MSPFAYLAAVLFWLASSFWMGGYPGGICALLATITMAMWAGDK